MRALAATTLSLVMLSASPVVLAAQKEVTAFDGVWREVGRSIVRPDSAVTRPPRQGMGVILHGHFSQIWFPAAPYAVTGPSPSTPEAKAARFDEMIANAGTIERVHDSTYVLRYEYAKNPATAGTLSDPGYMRVAGDTLWLITTSPWSKDSSKVVRTTTKSVRVK